jgi:penicillin-insensitive murein endopeptidase
MSQVHRRAVLAALGATAAVPSWAASRCFGTVVKGRLEDGVALPTDGANFSAYSRLGVTAGRTHVHSTVLDIVVDAYAQLATALPGTVFVYGETGWASGGRIRPHRSHQNGLSVDFFVPVRNAAGASVPLPTGVTNKLGYAIEFDAAGRFGDLRVDFAAIAEHLFQLAESARRHGAGLAMVIFDPPYLPMLLATPRGDWLREHVNFMKGRAWVRHDEHYHVDFRIACGPLG